MKKVLSAVLLSMLSYQSVSADYMLVLTDKDGNQTQECITSYSFSNNLESISKQKGFGEDMHSNEEVLTHKTWFGKPVYRMVFGPVVLTDSNSDVFTLPENNDFDTLVDIRGMVEWKNDVNNYNWRAYAIDAKGFKDIVLYKDKISFNHWGTDYSGDSTSDYAGKKVYAIYEYTKTTDVANTISSEFKSYLHYVSSSSTTEEVITKNMDELGVQFLKEYTYDSSTQSCNKIGL